MAKERETFLQKKEKKSGMAIFATVVMSIYSLLLVVPLLWAIMCSFKSMTDFGLNPFGLPNRWNFDNYLKAFTELNVMVESGGTSRRVNLAEMFANSLYYAIVCAFIGQFTRAACAYCAAKYRHHPEMRFMHKLVVVLIVFALPSSHAGMIRMRQLLGLYDNLFIGETILSIGFTGTQFLFYYAAFKGVSSGYMEAARIDGAGEFTIFMKVMFPLIRNTFFALFVLSFIALWNDYEVSVLYLPSHPVVAYGLFKFKTYKSIPIQLAGCSLVIIPTLTLFLIFKNKLVGNLSIGGLKG